MRYGMKVGTAGPLGRLPGGARARRQRRFYCFGRGMADRRTEPVDVEALNDRLALEHPSDDYYERSPWPIRLVERRCLAIIRRFVGDDRGLEIAEVGSGGGHVPRHVRGRPL